jgi:hypothetical protein
MEDDNMQVSYKESEFTGDERVDILRKHLENHQAFIYIWEDEEAGECEMTVDVQSISRLVMVFDKLSEKNKLRFKKLNFLRLTEVIWELTASE